ncbi:MAG: MarR family transcriptional regulator [Rhodospirillaceae bacterium]|nr:MarR family transcriptional regulator [Rhodospirillaceae bacterium]
MYEKILEPSGMTITQFSVLAALYYARSIPMKKLAQRLVMDRTTLTRTLSPLEQRKLVMFEDDPKDLRTRKVNLTVEGLEALVSALPYWKQAQEKMIAGLSEDLWRQLRSMLQLSVDVATAKSHPTSTESSGEK